MNRKTTMGLIIFCCLFLSCTAGGRLLNSSPSQLTKTDRALEVDFSVYDGSTWVDYIERPNGTDLKCKVDISGAIGLALTITVVLPEALEYTGEANPAPNDTSGNDLNGTNLYWTYDTGGGSRTVTFHVEIMAEGTFESLAVGLILLPPVSDSDTINITGTESENLPPEVPERPTGETNGKIGTNYTYSTVTTDPDDDQVYYQWKWGDGETSTWLGPFDSGVSHQAKHSWDTKGSYEIQVRSKDIHNATSDWSDPLPVKMPYFSVFTFIDRLIERFPILSYFFHHK